MSAHPHLPPNFFLTVIDADALVFLAVGDGRAPAELRAVDMSDEKSVRSEWLLLLSHAWAKHWARELDLQREGSV